MIHDRFRLSSLFLIGLFLMAVSGSVVAQESPEKAIINKAGSIKYMTVPNAPPCITIAVERGDPATGPSLMLNKFAPGCIAPWHWHTPNEQLMIVSGALRIEMKGENSSIQ